MYKYIQTILIEYFFNMMDIQVVLGFENKFCFVFVFLFFMC